MDEHFPELWDFLGGYLHQDWYLDYAAWADAFDDYVTGADLTALIAEIDGLLAMDTSDEAVADKLISLGTAFRPKGDDGTSRGWLTELKERAQQALARRDVR